MSYFMSPQEKSRETVNFLLNLAHDKICDLLENCDNLRLLTINVNFARVLEEHMDEMNDNIENEEQEDSDDEEPPVKRMK